MFNVKTPQRLHTYSKHEGVERLRVDSVQSLAQRETELDQICQVLPPFGDGGPLQNTDINP